MTTESHNIRQHRLSGSRSYRLCRQISIYLDDHYLDGILGLVPIVGGMVSNAMGLVFVYVAIVKLRSFRLSLVILFNIIKDFVIGLIPFVGVILDFFYKSNKRNFALLDGFAAGDPNIIQQVNQQATFAAISLMILISLSFGLIYLTIWLGMEIMQYLLGSTF